MLTKRLTGKDILEMIKKQLKEEGMVFKSITDSEDFFPDESWVDIEVGIAPKKVTPSLSFPEGVRTPTWPSDRTWLANQPLVQSIGDDPGLAGKMEKLKRRREGGTAYTMTGPSTLRSTFANPGPDSMIAALNDEHDLKVGLTR